MASGTYPLSLEIPGLPPCPERPEQVCAACLRLAQAVLPGEPLTFYPPSNLGPDGTFPSRSFESNLNTYKRLAIKLPDDQIVKVGDVAHCPESHPTFPADPRLPGCTPAMRLWHVWRGHSVPPHLAEQL